MGYLKYAYPTIGGATFQEDNRLDSLLSSPPLSTTCKVVPTALSNALEKTFFGIRALKKLKRSCRDAYKKRGKIKLEINLFDQSLKDPNSGDPVTDHGQTYEANGGVIMNITSFDTGDRMKNWTDEERYLIIACHESVHLKYERLNKKRYLVVTDECYGVYTKCHKRAFYEEFKARIEYSLLFSGKSTAKSSWLEAYFTFFEIYSRLHDPIDSERKEVKEIKDLAKTGLLFIEIPEFKTFVEKIKKENKFEHGKEICRSLYEDVIEFFEKKKDPWGDEVEKSTLEKIEEILNDKGKYLSDDEFKLIV